MYLMFMGPFTDGGDWSDTGIKGIDRFVQRAWKFAESHTPSKKKTSADSSDVTVLLHKTIQRVTHAMDTMHFNTAISALMELLNILETKEDVHPDTVRTFALLLSPLAPHLSEELWETLGGEGLATEQQWPHFDPKLLVSDTATIVIQVNGKVRGQIEVPADISKDGLLAAARGHQNVAKYLESGVKKEIVVPGKLVSFVV